MDFSSESIERWLRLLLGVSGGTWFAFFLNRKLYKSRNRKIDAETDSIIIQNFRDLLEIENERTERYRLQAEQALAEMDKMAKEVKELKAIIAENKAAFKANELTTQRLREEVQEWRKKYLELEISYNVEYSRLKQGNPPK